MTFRVGQKVVCVSEHTCTDTRLLPGGKYVPIWPVVGEVYTVRGLTSGVPLKRPLLFLEELVNPVATFLEGKFEMGWNPERFRPLIERKTDISVFTEILRKATKPARTPAMPQQDRQ
ncbi:hypothetical protein [Bradyrhizobium sp. 62]|uniref:hypothetical protein n=1 Tax=Bradyrhizobium sp. 62 TaxID=1043588 RepID=UPI001FF9F557|nr:hypothetical protein [Bradyrhizobium sp. 62]MCK1367662.1 hypothetical protein [Bradyrhizobium sp. 62]